MMIKIYGDLESGNCYKVKMLLEFLGIAHEWIYIEVLRNENRTADFLKINPNGKIPVLALEDGTHLAESNAILFYLAQGTRYLPEDRLQKAQILQWQFFEQYEIEPHIAIARYWLYYLKDSVTYREQLEEKYIRGYAGLGVMEQHLATRQYLVGECLSIADISLYSYVHVAAEGNFDLAPYPSVRAWLRRIEAEPGFFPMRPK